MGAKRVFSFATFGLFSRGLDQFDRAYEAGGFDRVFTTNLVYQKPELKERKWYCSVNMDRYIAALIDTVNKGQSPDNLIKPGKRIREMIELYHNK